MAEPARKLPEQDPRDYSWQPRVIAGGGESTDERANLQSVPHEHAIETPTEEAAHNKRRHLSLVPELQEAEDQAAAGAGTPQGDDVASRENEPNYYYKPRVGKAKADAQQALKDAKIRSATYRQNGGRRRGLLIGFGAGGGLLSIVAGFSALLPFKLPGIMDTIIDDAGKRVEKVVERRAERIFIMYMLKGSSAAVKTGNVIVTGNPIGDLFANIRTSNFEKSLKANVGLEFEPGPNKTVKLIHNGKDLGNVRNADDILKILAQGENGGSLSRADIRKIVRTQIPAWRFWKRAKFVNWLRIKYNIPRWGTREQNADEKDEDYEKSVKKEHIERVETANMENMTDFVDCAAESGDCADKMDEGSKMTEQTEKAVAEAADELAKDGAKKSTSTMVKLIVSKLTSSSASAYIPYIGWADMAARINHGLGEIINNGLLQKKHAEYIKRSSAVLATAYAGYSDQSKAGDNKAEIVGGFSDSFDGWEGSVTYGLVQSSALGIPIVGTQLEDLEKVNESIDSNTFTTVVKTLFGTVGWIGRAPLEAWYYTVSQLFDLAGNLIGGAVNWVIEHTPAAALMAQLGSVMNDIFAGILKFVGMYVDPLVIGEKLALFVHQGFLSTFNDKAHEDGMRKLSDAQALVIDNEIQQDHIADLQNESLYDRIFNLGSTDSLATKLVSTMPSSAINDPVSSLASASARLVASVPTNLAIATTSRASAVTADEATSESFFGINPYGGTEADMSADIDNGVVDAAKTCPENNDNDFNHCKIDREVVESMNCVFVKCADMYGQQANLGSEPLFAYDAQGPLYGPDAVDPTPKYGAITLDWSKAGGMLAALVPIGALEVSRRKFL